MRRARTEQIASVDVKWEIVGAYPGFLHKLCPLQCVYMCLPTVPEAGFVIQGIH